MMYNNGKVARHENAAWQDVDGKAVVVTSHTRKIHILSGVGGHIWQLLAESMSFDDIVDSLCREYEAARDVVQEDVLRFLDELLDKQIIKVTS